MSAHYREAAKALRELADRLATLADRQDLDDAPGPYVRLGIMPGHAGAHPGNAALVDTVAAALLGQPGRAGNPASNGVNWAAHGSVGPIIVSVHEIVPDPVADKDAEIARLRAELDALRGGGEPS